MANAGRGLQPQPIRRTELIPFVQRPLLSISFDLERQCRSTTGAHDAHIIPPNTLNKLE